MFSIIATRLGGYSICTSTDTFCQTFCLIINKHYIAEYIKRASVITVLYNTSVQQHVNEKRKRATNTNW